MPRVVSEHPRDHGQDVVACLVLDKEIARGGQEVRCVGRCRIRIGSCYIPRQCLSVP
jgi:hypothetical protein